MSHDPRASSDLSVEARESMKAIIDRIHRPGLAVAFAGRGHARPLGQLFGLMRGEAEAMAAGGMARAAVRDRFGGFLDESPNLPPAIRPLYRAMADRAIRSALGPPNDW